MPHAASFDGTPIWYDTRGAGRPGEPYVVLLSGQSLDHHMWDGVWEPLARRFRVVLVDNRGTGRSRSLGPTPLTTDVFAADVRAVAARLASPRLHVAGFSMGGRIAQALAVRYPDLVASLVLLASGPGEGREVPRSDAANQALLGAATPAGRAAMTDLFYTPGYVTAHPDQPERILPHSTPESMRAHFAASRRHSVWDALPQVQVPTLVLHGADDQLTPVANAHVLADRIPGARTHVLPGRHGFLHEHADETVAVMTAFWESLADAPDADAPDADAPAADTADAGGAAGAAGPGVGGGA